MAAFFRKLIGLGQHNLYLQATAAQPVEAFHIAVHRLMADINQLADYTEVFAAG